MKNKNLGYVVLGILLVLVSVIAFVIPTEKPGTFWIAYVFTAVAFAAQIVIWKNALGKEDTQKSKFLGLPVVYIGIAYLIAQVVAFAVFTAIPALPIWSAVVACSAIVGISAVLMIAGEAGRGEIERVEEKVQKKVFFIRELQADVELIAAKESNADLKIALTQLAERIRFSDPMSNEHMEDLEIKISSKVAELKNTINRLETITELNSLLDERDKKVKMLK